MESQDAEPPADPRRQQINRKLEHMQVLIGGNQVLQAEALREGRPQVKQPEGEAPNPEPGRCPAEPKGGPGRVRRGRDPSPEG